MTSCDPSDITSRSCDLLPTGYVDSANLDPTTTGPICSRLCQHHTHLIGRFEFIITNLIGRFEIQQCKEQSLNSESFLAAVRTPFSQTEVERVQEFVAMETDRLKTRGVSGTDQQRLASLEVVMTTLKKQLEGEAVSLVMM